MQTYTDVSLFLVKIIAMQIITIRVISVNCQDPGYYT